MNKSSLFSLKSIRRDLLVLFGLALLVRFLAALPQHQPNYMDAAYSYVNAVNLAEGRGFVEDFVWNYLDNPPSPPHSSHLYWMPLTSILAWLGMILGGISYRAAQTGFIILSALLAPISFYVAYVLAGQRWSGWLAGLLAIFSGFYFPFWTAIDNFTPFAVFGSLAIILAWHGMESGERGAGSGERGVRSEGRGAGSGKWEVRGEERRTYTISSAEDSPASNPQSAIPYPLSLIAAGVCAGLAHLARADGPLFLIAIILAYLLHPLIQTRSSAISNTHYALRTTHYALRFAFYLILGYLIIMTPWFIRNWRVAGTPLPAAGSQTIWLTTAGNLFSSYNGLFSYGRELSARVFFAQGLGPILRGRWWVLTTNLQTVIAVWGMIFLGPLALVGGWHLRRHRLIQLAGWYTLLLFVALTLVFAFPGALGGLFHSGGAVLPFIYAAGIIGLDRMVDWIAARRRHWHAPIAKRVFGVSLVTMAVILSCFIYYRRVLKNDAWNRVDSVYPAIAAWIAEEDPQATVMINNPPAYRYHGGGLSVVVPNENLETTLRVAERYRVDYLILGPNDPAALADIYRQTVTHPHLSLVKTFGSTHIFEIIEP